MPGCTADCHLDRIQLDPPDTAKLWVWLTATIAMHPARNVRKSFDMPEEGFTADSMEIQSARKEAETTEKCKRCHRKSRLAEGK
jgi:hypothetical protein